MSQPSTAAIVVASIFGGIALVFGAYKAYCKLWRYTHRSEELPPISQPQTAYHGGVVMSTVTDAPTFASIDRHASSNDFLAASSASTSTWPHADGLASTSTSEMPSPSIRPLDSVVLSTPSDVYDPHLRGTSTISSSSSTMTLKRSYLRSPSASQLSYMSHSSRRESYLPHSPLNRDSIQIIPPQPLGFGGSMAMATDQRTLAFSSNSGIGTSDDFTSGLVWTERNSDRPHRAQQDRRRYLAHGPTSVRSSSATPSQLSSSQPSPTTAARSLASRTPDEQLYPAASPSSETQTPGANDAAPQVKPEASAINPQLLSAKDSPLQRLQSNAGSSALPRPPSHDSGTPSDSDTSPILSPFVPQSGPPSSSNSAASHSNPLSAETKPGST
ncbi:hypothetical protein PHSY_004432 [Pseudozyma hubeiensis SY62]|uniref:Uncharacterized protein n=1 Tax=Pseudozyma hubeiensis (strain SY62) TaxID=1305764 RepID=R9P636_PSEHS|nr:hypothetical protein PHSY_004432 [Pseudozyma hubeiensis SY62]GAC96848.1 hypothetical protein PHSY_004432 [Pseudozyma hubeiensis SY62]